MSNGMDHHRKWALEALKNITKRDFEMEHLEGDFSRLGLQSIELASLAGELSARFGFRIYPEDLEEYDSLEAVLQWCLDSGSSSLDSGRK